MRYEETERVIEEGRARERARKNAILRAIVEQYRYVDGICLLRQMKGLNVAEREKADRVLVLA